ncbi:hypothetical protein BDP81DRAFT_484641 [Colletotrichum phormii]|uniref:Uncharacterized protein n=1 Tax=Colletotrichum phormii TaxID=359342 RepID=A0AAI9ZIN4_9PEZI|nr:uncharacterized protein BDP81DRAFT_484641 [Colletotrichum phormii]KAK1624096.1 hypothetical protein BDP81DRAFT_484641 [Colletotrichum phormii]
MASPQPRHETINLEDFNEHARAPRNVPQQGIWSNRKNTEDHRRWSIIELAGDNHSDWPRYAKVDEASSAHPSPLKTTVSFNQTNFLHPPTPDREDCSYSHKGNEFNDTISLTSRSHKDENKKTSPFVWWTLCLWLVGVLMLTLTALYSTGSAKALMRQNFFVASPSNSILILRVMTELCALVLAALVVVVMEDLQWALASRPGGVSLLHFVGLDAGTGVWGLLRLLATAEWRQKYSSLFRLLVICSIPLPGIILMGAISIELVTFPEKTYNVSAGIAPFNASYIYEIRQSTATALLVQMGSPAWSDRDTFSLDPLHQGVGKCTGADGGWAPCDESHLLTGGVVSIAPQADNLTSYPDSAAYVVPNTRVAQLEYGKVHDLDGLRTNGTCFLIGADSAASYWCAAVGKQKGLLFAWTNPLELSSSLYVYSRYATITYDRGNFSILDVSDMTPPEQDIIGLDEYMLSLSAVVPGFNKSGGATKGDNSALAIYAVTALPINDSEVAKKQSLRAVRKALSVPFSYFHANYFSDGLSIWELKGPREGLPDDMYSTLAISILSHQVVAGTISRWFFVTVAGIILCISLAIIIATSRVCVKRPERCGYPTLDFAAVCAVRGGIPSSSPEWGNTQEPTNHERGHASGLHRSLTQLGQKPQPFGVAKNIKNERVILS